MLEERQYLTKSIAERRKERDEAEQKRLQEVEEKRQLTAEFYDRAAKHPAHTERVDLKQMGFKSDADLDNATDTLASLPENTDVHSQRFSASTSLMGPLKPEREVPKLRKIANQESGPLASFTG